MTQFTLNVENVKRLTSLGGQVKDMSSVTKPIFVPSSDGSLSVNLYSSKNAMSFKVDILDFSSDDTEELNFFSINLDDFCTTIHKVSNVCENDILVTVDKTSNKVMFKNIQTGSRISLATFNSVVSLNEAKASITAVDTVYQNHFGTGSKVIEITPEIIGFYESAQRFMNMYPQGRSNSIAVCHNKARFGNGLAVFEKTLPKEVSSFDGNIYLKKTLVDFVKPFVKANGKIEVSLNENDSIAYIDASVFDFKAILTLEAITYEFPSEEETAGVVPRADHMIRASLDKKATLDAINLFDGTFKNANWNWKAIRLDSSKKYISAGVLAFEHHDRTAECETTCPVEILEDTINADTIDFIISSQALKELIDLVPEEKFVIEYNEYPPTEANGGYTRIKSDTLNAMIVKIRDKG